MKIEVVGRSNDLNRVRFEGKSYELTDEELETLRESGALPVKAVKEQQIQGLTIEDRVKRLEATVAGLVAAKEAADAEPSDAKEVRERALFAKTNDKLQALAKEHELDVDPKAEKRVLVAAIIAKEFPESSGS